MGDRCYLEITIRKVDLPVWEKVFGDHKNGEFRDWFEPTPLNETATSLTLYAYEANYGYYTELEAAAARGLVFYGHNGAGGDYGPSAWASDGKRYSIQDTGHDGNLVVTLGPDGKVPAGVKNAASRYRSVLKRAVKAMV